MIEILLPTGKDTQKLGQQLAKLVVAGDVIRLEGELGMGKSTIARAFIKAMGTKETHIPSPTYIIAQIYSDTEIPIAHLDCYRLESAEDLQVLGLENIFRAGVIIAEWPLDFLVSIINTAGTLSIELTEFKSGRIAKITATETWKERLESLRF